MIPGSANPLLLASAAAAPTGYAISRSLRFNSVDSASLSLASYAGSGTFSCWVKRCKLGAAQTIISGVAFNASDQLNGSTAVFRDPSAWMHIVVSSSGTYVNGASVGSGTSITPSAIGSGCDLYLADVHFIDGQNLDPTSFGEFDTNGIWQPKAYIGTYGTNGFHLDFADNSTAAALGTDTSGNGNTWTVNNISAAAGVNYANTSTTSASSGTIPNGGTPYWIDILPTNASLDYNGTGFNVHDSSLANYVYWVGDEYGSGNVTRARFDLRGFPSIASVQLYMQSYSGYVDYRARLLDASKAVIAGTDIALTSYTLNWISIPVSGTPRYLEIYCSSGAARRLLLYAVRVNGITLINGGAGDIDSLVDVPTNGTETDTGLGGEVRGNYCTLNPLASGVNGVVTFSDGNLQASWSNASGYAAKIGTIGVSTGKWYWEVLIGGSASYYILGAMPSGASLDQYVGQSNGYGYYSTGTVYPGNTSYGSSYAPGDLIGVALDLDNGRIFFSKNGTWQNSGNPATGANPAFSGITGTHFPAISEGSSIQACVYTCNFGQRPFAYTAPSGFKALCTANLPAPVVTKPSEYMDVKLYTGNGSTQTISGLEFSPDLVWIKNRAQLDNHKLLDTVRGATEELESNTEDAEVTNADGLTAFNSDGFDLGADVEYNTSTEAYVAWAWDAGSSTVTNTDGSITSQVRANPSAGFSVVTYTGTGSNATVGHGLNVAPSLIIVKCRSAANDWAVYHAANTADPKTDYLLLNSTAATADDNTYWNDTAPTSTVFSIGTNADVNTSTATYVAYCWSELGGYSSFGSYTGNGSADGPFVFCNFRPRWVLLKNTSQTADWVVVDAARLGYNAANSLLFPDGTSIEAPGGYMDLLSNGFKILSSLAELNQNTSQYIYAAFAESPFQYARAR
jgi:hypothetical protein